MNLNNIDSVTLYYEKLYIKVNNFVYNIFISYN